MAAEHPRSMSVTRRIDAAPAEVWAVLADFPGIATWNGGVKASRATGDATSGVGATRHCDLAPFGELEETIRQWEPLQRMVVSIDEARKIPIDSAVATFTLQERDGGTDVTIDYSYGLRYGFVGSMMGPMMDRQFTKGFSGFLADLESAARERAAV